jgi:hypothetical protein
MSDEYNEQHLLGYRAGLEKALSILAETSVRSDGWAAHDEAQTLITKDLGKHPAPHGVAVGPMPETFTPQDSANEG